MRSLFGTFAVLSCLSLPFLPMGPGQAVGKDVMVLRLPDGTGQAQAMICRPAAPGEAIPTGSLPVSPVVKLDSAPSVPPVTVSTPVSPVPAQPAPPTVARVVTPPNPCPPPPRPNNLGMVPGASLYAAPAAVAAAWECYAPRQMAYASRPWRGPDPAMHSPLPPLRRSWRPAPRAAAKPAPTVNIDVLATMIQTLCAPVPSATSAVPAVTPSSSVMPTPNAETRPAAVQPQATTPARPVSLLDAAPVRPNTAMTPNGVYTGAAPSVP